MELRIKSVNVGIERKFGSLTVAKVQKAMMTAKTRTSFRFQSIDFII
jgi:hypothetical protein